jgi:hypothetical protein
VVCSFGIAQATAVSYYDVLLWLVVLAMIGARYLDVARFGGMTVNAEAASMGHVKRYAGMLVVLALALWGAARALAL